VVDDTKKPAVLERAEEKVDAGKDLTAAEQRALDAVQAEADELRGYTEIKYHGRTMYRPIGGGDLAFDSEVAVQDHVTKSRLQANLAGGVGA
jgi:hypothetical protein